MKKIEIIYYKTRTGKEPFIEWLIKLDQTARSTVELRLLRVMQGKLGDVKSLKNTSGLLELRIHLRPGLRIYVGFIEETIILILGGGTKDKQCKDIENAINFWQEYWSDYEK